jgi:hypothetical protein
LALEVQPEGVTDMLKLKRWYFTTSLEGSYSSANLIKAAVKSALKNTQLEPVCIYEGLAPDLQEFLIQHGVELHQQPLSFIGEMARTLSPTFWFHPPTATGAYLKLSAPQFETRDEFILCTDTDVIFERHPELPSAPTFLAGAPEFDPQNYSYFNSGVMVMNVATMKPLYYDLISFVMARARHKAFRINEQGDLNGFFWGVWDHLRVGANWKPYWGVNPDAEIIHFQGPKASDYLRYASGAKAELNPGLVQLLEQNLDGYKHYSEKFLSILEA